MNVDKLDDYILNFKNENDIIIKHELVQNIWKVLLESINMDRLEVE